jgi:hypothetical protein
MTDSYPAGEPPVMPTSVVGADIMEVAYAAAVKAVEIQDGTLSNIRNRATGLLSAVTVGTTFGAALGLFSTNRMTGEELPAWAQWTLLVLLVGVGGLCLGVMWPATMAFGVDARLVLQRAEQDNDILIVRRYVIDELVGGHGRNRVVLKRKFFLYRLAVFVLVCETAVLLLALIVRG